MKTGNLAVWMSLSLSAPLGAQIANPRFGIATGLAIPAGQFHSAFRNEGFNQGLEEMVFLSFRVRGVPADLRLAATYRHHGANDALKADVGQALGGTGNEHVNLIGLSLDLSRSLLSGHRFTPYVIAGAGVTRSSVSISAGPVTGTSAGQAFAWSVGGGFLCGLKKVSLLLESRFVSVQSAAGLPRITVIPIVFGLRFGNG